MVTEAFNPIRGNNRFAQNNLYIDMYKEFLNRPDIMMEMCLQISSKNGDLIKFCPTRSQIKVMRAFMRQWERNNHNVRLVILKGRQQGISTLCHALIFWFLITHDGMRAMLMANTQRDLERIHFKRFADMARSFDFKPISAINITAKTLEIDHGEEPHCFAEGRWAQTESGVRGGTFNAVHLTEIDWYRNFEECFATVMGAVTAKSNTVVLIESTSCGHGNLYNLYNKHIEGNSNFEFIFLPWFNEPEYTLPLTEPLVLTDGQKEMQATYNISDEHMNWYQKMLWNMGNDETRMKHEFPSCIEDGFEESDVGSCVFDFFSIDKACHTPFVKDNEHTLILGIDPSGSPDGDETAMVWRRGQNIERIDHFKPPVSSDQEIADKLLAEQITNRIYQLYPDSIYIDIIGTGRFLPVYLRNIKGIRAEGVCFSSSPSNHAYCNRRAELYERASFWLKDGAHIPNNPEFIRQLKSIRYIPGRPKIQIESKDEIRARLHRSPDIVDAFVMTFPYDNDGIVTSGFSRMTTWSEMNGY